MIETQMAVKAKQVSELETQAEYLQRTAPEKMEEIQVKKAQVEERFEQLKAPLLDRQRQLEKKKEAFQFRRDVEDEKLWIAEKMPQATSTEYGNSLFNVNMLKKKNQVMNHFYKSFLYTLNYNVLMLSLKVISRILNA
jgi:spectrin beta